MNKNLKLLLSASMAALCAASVGLTADAYKLSSEVKDVTPALREASTVGVWTGGNPALANKENKDAILVMTFAMVKVLPVPVAPSKTCAHCPSRRPSVRDATAFG